MRRLRSDTLKIMAMAFMLVDHIGYGLVQPYLFYVATVDYDRYLALKQIYDITRIIGRLAFPVFCYQIAVGLMWTRSRAGYLRNLLLFGLISEIPYDLLCSKKLLETTDQNVYFTLFLGALVICGADFIRERFLVHDASADGDDAAGNRVDISYVLVLVAMTVAASALAEIIKSDYGAKGVILIVIFYALRNDRIKLQILSPLLFVIDIVLISFIRYKSPARVLSYCQVEIYACFAFPLIYADSGERRGGKVIKWFGYAFYPAHLFILYLIKTFILHL